MKRAAALSTNDAAQDAAQAALSDGASALGAALAGFFVAAGHDAGVLFAPLTLVVGGLGSGVFAYDGRHRQPGRDAKRPRGFQEGEEVPLPAQVAVPGSVFAAAVACAFHPGTSILSCARPGVAAAKASEAPERAALIEIIATKGALALSDTALKKALISQCGTVEQGLVTPADLVAPEGIQQRALVAEGGWVSPWSNEARDPSGRDDVIVAADSQGLFAGVSYSRLEQGPRLDPYRVTLPLSAVPVMRGVPRTSPGSALPHGNRLRILSDGGVGGIEAVAGDQRLQITRVEGTKDVAARMQNLA